MVFRTCDRSQQLEILLFQHPAQDIQFVKGTVEDSEDLLSASIRELWEESGLKVDQQQLKFFKHFRFEAHQQEWFVYWTFVQELRDGWSWQTMDDYGHQFKFFWCSLREFAMSSKDWEMDDRFRMVMNEVVKYFSD